MITYGDLLHATRDIFADEMALDLAIASLRSSGTLSLGHGDSKMDRLVKFANASTCGAVELTDMDANIIK